jgi:hypothetical protein
MIGPEAPSNFIFAACNLIGPVAYSRANTRVKASAAAKAAPIMGIKLGSIRTSIHILIPYIREIPLIIQKKVMKMTVEKTRDVFLGISLDLF